MILRLEHVGIAVNTLDDANALFEQLLGVPPYKKETVESESVVTSFFQNGETKIELLATTEENGPIGRFIAKRGEGIHHLAFEVDDIYAEMERLSKAGVVLLNEHPKLGADQKLVCFLHPKSTRGVLVELCQTIPQTEG